MLLCLFVALSFLSCRNILHVLAGVPAILISQQFAVL